MKDMREPDGTIAVTCEFCSTRYPFSDDDLH
ncbi:MAG: Hsp33 family molecular chaperone HslO [Hyphomicrobiaceae bacterium]